MRHISKGALRQMLDQPQLLAPKRRAHLQSCAKCRTVAAAVVADAGRVAVLMEGSGKVTADPAPALSALRSGGLNPLSVSSGSRSWRFGSRPMLRPVLGVALVGLMGTLLVGTGVAGNLIKIFEPDKLVAVPVDIQTLSSLPDLRNYGEITMVSEPTFSAAANMADAARLTGLTLLEPVKMPSGVGVERIQVASAGTASFTFDAARARAAGDGNAVPDKLDGSSLFLQAGPLVVQTFGGPADRVEDLAVAEQAARAASAPEQVDLAGLLSSLPDLMIVQMKSPVVSSNGPTVAEYRDALLTLPNLSPALKAQIEAVGDPSTTLPLPIPIDLASSRRVDINGAAGLAVGDNTGVGSGVVWQSGGVVRAVAGTLAEDEVLAIARSMR